MLTPALPTLASADDCNLGLVTVSVFLKRVKLPRLPIQIILDAFRRVSNLSADLDEVWPTAFMCPLGQRLLGNVQFSCRFFPREKLANCFKCVCHVHSRLDDLM